MYAYAFMQSCTLNTKPKGPSYRFVLTDISYYPYRLLTYLFSEPKVQFVLTDISYYPYRLHTYPFFRTKVQFVLTDMSSSAFSN